MPHLFKRMLRKGAYAPESPARAYVSGSGSPLVPHPTPRAGVTVRTIRARGTERAGWHGSYKAFRLGGCRPSSDSRI